MKKAISFAIATLLLTACQSSGVSATGNVTVRDLQHRNFALISVNGATVSNKEDSKLSIAFGEKMFVSATMCNHFMGMGKLKKRVLTASILEKSQMFCVNEQLHQWDQVIYDVLTEGATVRLKSKQLTLTNDKNTLVYVLRDITQ
ncbi:META domain-containing protein [Xenorhabdus bovienii]|uniref:Heat shock protein hslJ n=2 Tax=Xenorhabdus bovienii TaxID=40576 RepID=A0A077PMK3_XENBV|nr:META domain-containing protein [Xenorhabdus bovienii]MDE1480165.1 META domain-containing protein [Xenorhabdus bovienii]MDE1486723.1 META domain-containing protein [Xenorhabdus bovienii]MDE1492534.1 META domain-containing protein [Xenorhabdus bovienii]MDE1493988.1 META domain-containing protein [Xenorhabdus bovienii]MDE9472067.1 META domain-containing protein [Xenorhabdus bovienii]